MPRIRRHIGKYLKQLRTERKLTLNEVVADLSDHRVDCSHAHLSRIELGQSNCRSEIIAGLALIYGVRTDDILYYGLGEC